MHQIQFTKKPLQFLTMGLAGVLFSTAAVAQTLPTQVDPAVQSQQFKKTAEPRSSATPMLSIPAETTPGSMQDDRKIVTLEKVVFDGATVYQQADFASLTQSLIGAKVSFADLSRLAQQATSKYRDDGYLLSRVVLPPQDITNGEVRLQVHEGYISNVQILGDVPDSRGLLTRYAEKIKAERPIRASTLERYLLLMDDLPGATAKSVVRASTTTPDAADLLVTVEHDSIEGAAILDNRGSRIFGRYRGMVTAAANSALGLYDRTAVRGLVTAETDEMRFGEITHEEQLGSEGLRVQGRGFVVDTNAGGRNEPLDIEGDTKGIELGLYYPLLRSRQTNLNITPSLA